MLAEDSLEPVDKSELATDSLVASGLCVTLLPGVVRPEDKIEEIDFRNSSCIF